MIYVSLLHKYTTTIVIFIIKDMIKTCKNINEWRLVVTDILVDRNYTLKVMSNDNNKVGVTNENQEINKNKNKE